MKLLGWIVLLVVSYLLGGLLTANMLSQLYPGKEISNFGLGIVVLAWPVVALNIFAKAVAEVLLYGVEAVGVFARSCGVWH